MILISTAVVEMPTYIFVWCDKTVEHLEEHAVNPDEFESVVQDPHSNGINRSTGRPYAVSILDDGREVMCIFEFIGFRKNSIGFENGRLGPLLVDFDELCSKRVYALESPSGPKTLETIDE